jgi:adenine-specific DNA-methyltransferase
VLNSSVNRGGLRTQIFLGQARTDFLNSTSYCSQLIVPSASQDAQSAQCCGDVVLVLQGDARFEQLINGLVFELFFPDDLHRANIRFSMPARKPASEIWPASRTRRSSPPPTKWPSASSPRATPSTPCSSTCKRIEVVRIIEGKRE